MVEPPRGTTCKLDFDPDLRVFPLAKPLMAGLTYPYDWASFHRRRRRTAIPSTVIHDAQAEPATKAIKLSSATDLAGALRQGPAPRVMRPLSCVSATRGLL